MSAPSSSASSSKVMLHHGRSEQSEVRPAQPTHLHNPNPYFQPDQLRRFRDAEDDTNFSHWSGQRSHKGKYIDTSVRDISNPVQHDQSGRIQYPSHDWSGHVQHQSHDWSGHIQHQLGPAESVYASAGNSHIKTISSSLKDNGGESSRQGFDWMNSPVLQLSSRGDLHGEGYILPRVSNSMLDRSSAPHKTDLPVFNVFSRSSNALSSAGYAPYLFQNFHNDATLSSRPDHHGNGGVLPMDFSEPRHHLFRHVTHDVRSGSPSPSSYNFNNHAGPTKRSSLPKNLGGLDLPSKNQIAEIRRMYDKTNNTDDLAFNNKLSSGRGRDSSLRKTTTFNETRVASRKSRRGEYPTLSFHFHKDFGYDEDSGTLKRRESSGDSPVAPSVKLREDFDESHRRRKRNHIIFLVIVMLIVAIAVMSAILAATLGSTRGKVLKDAGLNYSVVLANLTLKILNRSFQIELLDTDSQIFKNLSLSYTTEIDRLFLKSKLARVYSENEILYFRNGSIFATSSITFADEGLIKSSQDVENVISSAETATEWKHDDALQLGEFVVCRSCGEVKLEYLTVNEKPEIMSSDSAQSGSLLNKTFTSTTVTTTLPVITTSLNTTNEILQGDSKNQSFKNEDVTSNSFETIATSQGYTFTTESLIESSDTDLITLVTLEESGSTNQSDNVLVTCLVKNFNTWTNISMWLQTEASGPGNMIMSLEPSGFTRYGPFYSSGIQSHHHVNDTHILLSITLLHITCRDIGNIHCLWTGGDGERSSSVSKLDVPASRPLLTVPSEIIEKKQIDSVVTCEAEMGHPPWTMKMSAHLTNGSVYDLPAEKTLALDYCHTQMVIKLSGLMPSLAINGTVLLCEVVGTKPQQSVLSSSEVLYVVEEAACRGKANISYLFHPRNCSYYIMCIDAVPRVQLCPSGLCFDFTYNVCGVETIPLIAQANYGVINHGLASIRCSVSRSIHWSEIIILRNRSSEPIVEILIANSQMQLTWKDTALEMRALTNLYSSNQRDVLEVWIYVLKCNDPGTYTCVVRNSSVELTSSTDFFVFGRPEKPTLTVPGRAIEGSNDTAIVQCEANVGRPAATLMLKRKLLGELEFSPVTFTQVKNSSYSTCLEKRTGEYWIQPPEIMNGSVFRCEVIPPPEFKELRSEAILSEENKFFVLPNKTCAGLSSSLLPHPHDCRLLVECVSFKTSVHSCGSGRCFNVTSLQCDGPPPQSAQVINVNSCYPDKHGDFLPHLSNCDKYIQCDYGQEITRHCPPQQIYSGNGTCTKNITQSYCFINNRFW